MKSSILALSIFMGGLALIAAPALAGSDSQGNEETIIQNFNQPTTTDATDTDTDADADETDVEDQAADNDDQGDDNDDQGEDDGGASAGAQGDGGGSGSDSGDGGG